MNEQERADLFSACKLITDFIDSCRTGQSYWIDPEGNSHSCDMGYVEGFLADLNKYLQGNYKSHEEEFIERLGWKGKPWCPWDRITPLKSYIITYNIIGTDIIKKESIDATSEENALGKLQAMYRSHVNYISIREETHNSLRS